MKLLRLINLLALVMAVSACTSPKMQKGPALDQVTEWNQNPVYTIGTPDELIDWLGKDTPIALHNTPQSRWHNGLAGCMTPFMVDWEQSEINGSSTNYLIVNNVLVSGNPIYGNSTHATIKIFEHSIERIEYVVVRYALHGPAKSSGHVQLRFVFNKELRPVVFDETGAQNQEHPYLDDLMISWEAWRPTATGWSFSKGLDIKNYALTARAYSGCQRFLNDSLRGAVWDAYPLELPDHPKANDVVLYSGLMMGDLLARRTLSELVEQEILVQFSDEEEKEIYAQLFDKAKKRLEWEQIPDDLITNLLKDVDLGYHAILQSCITVTQLQIELALTRLAEKYDVPHENHIRYKEDKLPKWFDVMEDGSTWDSVRYAPYALYWLFGHEEILPYKSYIPLHNAGLLQTDKKGRPILFRYEYKKASPYGNLKRNLM